MIARSADATPCGPYRRFTDEEGGDWIVWVLAQAAVEEIRDSSSLGRAWLMFLAPTGETRRLAPVPRNWRRVSDRELSRLARLAVPFGAH